MPRQAGGVKGPRNFSFAQLLFVIPPRGRARRISLTPETAFMSQRDPYIKVYRLRTKTQRNEVSLNLRRDATREYSIMRTIIEA